MSHFGKIPDVFFSKKIGTQKSGQYMSTASVFAKIHNF